MIRFGKFADSVAVPCVPGVLTPRKTAIAVVSAFALLFTLFAVVQIDEERTAVATVLSCADGGVCVVGDVGPGGGVVFYVEVSGSFVCGAVGELACRYLEAAPSGWFASVGGDPKRSWAHEEFQGVHIGVAAQGVSLGSGFANSVAVVAQGNVNPLLSAAQLARSFGGGGYSDWYLPSRSELEELQIHRVVVGMNTNFGEGSIYWTSSELVHANPWVWHQRSDTGVFNRRSDPGKNQLYRVRPVRAFGVVASSETTTTTTVPETTTTTTTVPPTTTPTTVPETTTTTTTTVPETTTATTTTTVPETTTTSTTVPPTTTTTARTSTTVLSCADGGVCVVGDVGPGGGVVFYVEVSGSFVCGAVGELACRYLEAAPSGWFASVGGDPKRSWAHEEFQGVHIGVAAQGVSLGSGFANSVAVVAQGNVNPLLSAAQLARSFGGGGYSDWYLPSRSELEELQIHRVVVGMNTNFGEGSIYWTSSELVHANPWVWHQRSDTGVFNRRSDPGKNQLYRVRPVRAFGVVASSTTTTTTVPETTTTTTTSPPPAIAVVRSLLEVKRNTSARDETPERSEVSLDGEGFVPFEYVQLVVASTPQVINSGYADAQGAITLSGVLPAELSVGDHTLALFAPSSGRGLRQTIAVTQAMTGAAMLPATGSDRRVLMWLGLGSLMLGVRLVRRPRSSQLTTE